MNLLPAHLHQVVALAADHQEVAVLAAVAVADHQEAAVVVAAEVLVADADNIKQFISL